MAIEISYHPASSYGLRRTVTCKDVQGHYLTYEEAKANYIPDFDGDSAILAKINGEWYRTSEFGSVVKYTPMSSILVGWHSLEEVLSGVKISNIPFRDMLAMAALTSYCNGTLAKALCVSEDELDRYGFHQKFEKFFRKPMYAFKV